MGKLTADATERFGWTAGYQKAVIQPLREKYNLDEDFDRRVMRYWVHGIAQTYIAALYNFLESEYKTQGKIAEFLGLKDRSGISKNRAKLTLTIEQLFILHFWHMDEVVEILASEEIPEQACTNGYMEAMSCVRAKEIHNTGRQEQKTMTREQYECLSEVLCGNEWSDAQKANDPEILKTVASKILRRIHEEVEGLQEIRTAEDIERLVREWGESFWLCVASLVEYVPPEPTQPKQ